MNIWRKKSIVIFLLFFFLTRPRRCCSILRFSITPRPRESPRKTQQHDDDGRVAVCIVHVHHTCIRSFRVCPRSVRFAIRLQFFVLYYNLFIVIVRRRTRGPTINNRGCGGTTPTSRCRRDFRGNKQTYKTGRFPTPKFFHRLSLPFFLENSYPCSKCEKRLQNFDAQTNNKHLRNSQTMFARRVTETTQRTTRNFDWKYGGGRGQNL